MDRPLLFIIAILVLGGGLTFASAAFGLLARGQSGMASIAFNHLILGVGLGLVGLFALAHFDYRYWKVAAPYIFACALIGTAVVFIPQIGFSHGGGTRWLNIFGVSVQPSEALKIAAVIFASAFFSAVRGRAESLIWGLGGFLAIITIPAILLFLQPDIGTLSVICISVFVVYVTAGAKWQHVAIAFVIALLCVGAILYAKPHARDRVMTFLNPSQDQQATGWQIKQSLIAIGSGQFLGRGFGQSVQKFTYLPEPMGAPIFALAAAGLGCARGGGGARVRRGSGHRHYVPRVCASRIPDCRRHN